MKNYDDWKNIKIGQLIEYECPYGGGRRPGKVLTLNYNTQAAELLPMDVKFPKYAVIIPAELYNKSIMQFAHSLP